RGVVGMWMTDQHQVGFHHVAWIALDGMRIEDNLRAVGGHDLKERLAVPANGQLLAFLAPSRAGSNCGNNQCKKDAHHHGEFLGYGLSATWWPLPNIMLTSQKNFNHKSSATRSKPTRSRGQVGLTRDHKQI